MVVGRLYKAVDCIYKAVMQSTAFGLAINFFYEEVNCRYQSLDQNRCTQHLYMI